MRKKPNLRPRLERCAELWETEPERMRGIWLREHRGHDEVHAELGCGKGRFTTETAQGAPRILLVAVERVADAQITAMERAVDMGLRNVRFITRDARDAELFFGDGELGRIYINFCDPWPGARHAKRRLTAPVFLESYRRVMKPGGEIHFKTDNADLFDYSLRRFASCGFELADVTRDLHAG
ncbi:MAG: tRNA (guanosine(46)-N7)-methyltransferase TrmB, partial [Oscillospiraceae bacterium]|nr:tRNA (guanosine(46)-N7)-methyltransferase TrmB [Oscillospiraceae bacterium]